MIRDPFRLMMPDLISRTDSTMPEQNEQAPVAGGEQPAPVEPATVGQHAMPGTVEPAGPEDQPGPVRPFEHVNILRLEPDDIVVIRSTVLIDEIDVETWYRRAKGMFPDHQVLIMNVSELLVCRPAPSTPIYFGPPWPEIEPHDLGDGNRSYTHTFKYGINPPVTATAHVGPDHQGTIRSRRWLDGDMLVIELIDHHGNAIPGGTHRTRILHHEG